MQKLFGIFFVISILFFSFAFSYSLYISEVFFDGWDEWIEIYNYGSGSFDGDLIISGSDNLVLEDVNIDSGEFLIFGETKEFDFSGDLKIFSGQSLSITDTEEINFDLIKSGQKIDNFFVEKSFVEKLDNQEKSFEKVLSGTETYITGTRQSDKENIGGDVIGNPGKVKIMTGNSEEVNNEDEEKSQNDEDGNQDNEEDSGNNLDDIGYHDLKIIEIFPKENKYYPEFFVIKAFDNFSGTIYSSGLWRGSSVESFDLHISSGEKLLISDSPKKLLTGKNTKILDKNISLSDNEELINIYYKTGVLLDKIKYSSSKSGKSIFYSNTEEKIRKFSEFDSPTPSLDLSKPKNCKLSIVGNGVSEKIDLAVSGMQDFHCGKYFKRKWFHNGKLMSGNSCNNTCQLFTGKNNIEFQLFSGEKMLCKDEKTVYFDSENSNTNLFSGDLKITEIYPYEKKFKEYIEIKALGNFSGSLEVEGLGRGDKEKTLDIKLYSGNHLVISDSYSGFVNTGNVYNFDSISLTNDGEKIALLGENGKIFDKVEYKGGNKNKSSYFGSLSGEKRIFSNHNSPTPGFGKDKLKYFLNNDSNNYSNNDCYIKLQNNNSIFADNSVNFISVLNGEELQNSSEYNCKIRLGNGEIVEKCNPYYIQYSSSGIYDIGLVIYKYGDKICRSKKTLNLPEENEGNSSCGSSSCKEDYYEDLYHKRKTKYKNFKKQKESKTKYLESDIKILSLLSNPEGKDGKKEVLKLKNRSSKKIDLNGYFLEYGRRKFNLSDISDTIGAKETKTFTGKFQFYNRSECIFLKKEGENKKIFDKFCYLNPESGELISGSLDFLSKLKDLSILSNFNIKIFKEKACLLHKDRKVFCKKFKFNSQKGKTNKSLEKKEGILEIVGVLPDPEGRDYDKEKIKIKLLTGNRSFENLHLFYSDRKNYIDLDYDNSDIKTISGTFLFLNSTNCIELRDNKYIYDEFCYFKPEEGKYVEDVPQLHNIKDFSLFSDLDIDKYGKQVCIEYKGLKVLCSEIDMKKKEYENNSESQFKDIQISELFPNPEGADEDKEYIVLQNNEENPVSLSGYSLEYGRRSYEFTGDIKLDYRKISGKLRFYNRSSCVKLLFGDSKIVDTFCYLEPDEGRKIKDSKDFLTDFQNLSILSKFDLEKKGKDICFYYKEHKIFCKDVIVGSIEDFKNQIKKTEKIVSSKNNEIDKLQKNIDNYKNKVKLRDNFIDFVIDKLKNEWYVVFKKSGLDKIKKIYDKLKDKLEKGKQYTTVNYMNIRLTKIRDINKAKSGDVFLDKIPDYVWNKYIVSNIPNKLFDVFKK